MTLGSPPRLTPHATQPTTAVAAAGPLAHGAMSAMPAATPWAGMASPWASAGPQSPVPMKMPR